MEAVNFPQRGEIYFLGFKDTEGRAMRDKHPALVIQNNKANRYSGVIIVVPLTTNPKVAELPVGVLVEPHDGGLKRRSVVHCGQIHTVDREEFVRESFCGRLLPTTMEKVNQALKNSLNLI